MQKWNDERDTRVAYNRASDYLLAALNEVAEMRQSLTRTPIEPSIPYAEEQWAKLPDRIADAIVTLIHSTYTDNPAESDRWHAWRERVRSELDELLRDCGPVRRIK